MVSLTKRRVLLLEVSGQRLKLGLFEVWRREPVLLCWQQIQLADEPALAEEQFFGAVAELCRKGPPPPILLLYPQHRCVSSVVDLPEELGEPIDQFLLHECQRQSALPASLICLRFKLIKPFGRFVRPVWTTWCRADELERWLRQLGLADPQQAAYPLLDVTTTGEALFCWARRDSGDKGDGVWIYVEEDYTYLGIVFEGQGVMATSLPVGYMALSGQQSCNDDIDRWCRLVLATVTQWTSENIGQAHWAKSIRWHMSGRVLRNQALVEQLRQRLDVEIALPEMAWHAEDNGPWDAPHFSLLAESIERPAAYLSLLPESWVKRARVFTQFKRLIAAVSVLTVLLLVLVIGQGMREYFRLERLRSARRHAEATLALAGEASGLEKEIRAYELLLKPIVSACFTHKDSLSVLASIASLQLDPKSEWFVTLCDGRTYSAQSVLDFHSPTDQVSLLSQWPVLRSNWIAELCLLHKDEGRTKRLAEIVNQLRSSGCGMDADLVPLGFRRLMANSNIAETDKLEMIILRPVRVKQSDQSNQSIVGKSGLIKR